MLVIKERFRDQGKGVKYVVFNRKMGYCDPEQQEPDNKKPDFLWLGEAACRRLVEEEDEADFLKSASPVHEEQDLSLKGSSGAPWIDDTSKVARRHQAGE